MNAAVADIDGQIDFFKNASSISGSLIERSGSVRTQVPVVAFDGIIENPIDLVKFDVEGAESALFRASKNIKNVATCIGEIHYDLIPESKDDFLRYFDGYEIKEKEIAPMRSIILAARK